MSSNEASELRISIARVLERWQVERIELEALLQDNDTRAAIAMLSEHIEEVKRAITPPGGALDPDPFVAEVARAERLTRNPPTGDRIAATLTWIRAKREQQTRGACGGGAAGTHCDGCGATLGMVSDGDGSPPRMFCLQCQPEELEHASVSFAPPVAVPAMFNDGEVRVRSLTAEEQTAMKAYLEFVQREPLPTTDAAARHRLEEAAVNWPQMAALFGPHIDALADAIAECEPLTSPACGLCGYSQAECRCIELGWR